MDALAQVERDYEKAKEREARPELLKKLEDQISSLRNEKTTHKEELITQDGDPFEPLFKKAVEELSKRYVDGTTDHIETHHPDLHREIDEAEDELNRVWRAGLEGKAGVEEFRAALGHWYRLHVRSIEIYTEQHKKEGE